MELKKKVMRRPRAIEEEESEPLSQVQHRHHRSQVARCSFHSQDRADMTSILNELCQKMVESQPTELCQIEKACQVSET